MASDPDTSDPEIGSALSRLGAATVGESGGRPMSARVTPAWPGARLAARAFTVRCSPGDNLAVHVAVARAPAGRVLVVDVGDDPERGYWGEVLTTAAEARALVGLVIDGCVRDVDALAAHQFPVFSTGVALPGATKRAAGGTGRPVRVGEVSVSSGDWVVADVDGVVVVPGAQVRDVLDAAGARAAKEQQLFELLRAGRTTLDLLGLDPTLVEDGSA